MAPERVGALRAAAGLLALTGVDRLEVVDVAVRLVEVAVAVGVVAVPDVELREVGLDLGRGLPGRQLRVVPGVDRVVDEAARSVRRRCRRSSSAVVGGVVGHGDPVGHLAVDGVAVRGLLRVEVAHRDVTGGLGEEHVHVVGWLKSGAQIVVLSTHRSGAGIWLWTGPGTPLLRMPNGESAFPKSARTVKIESSPSRASSTNCPLATLAVLASLPTLPVS